jgi:predicted site-specific integrase-resolvase
MPITTHLNAEHLARRWALSPRTLERWRGSGRGPKFLKLGGRIVYRLDDIYEYEEERLQERTAGNRKRACAASGAR